MHLEIDTGEQVMTVDGLRFSLDVLRAVIDPDRARFYRFRRDDETVTIESYTLERLRAIEGGE
jgi:hypothetical protein